MILTSCDQFRVRDRSNRSGRGQIEHNVLEGLPISQYREAEVTIGPNMNDNKPVDKNAWPELPMPRDSHMLPEHAQQLLRAARSGRIYKPPPPPEDDHELKDEEEEHKEVQTGFTIRKYVKVRHLEVAEPEYLAKRRKGLPSPYVHGQVTQPALRETKVKKLDAEGNVAVYKVLVPEGQAVEGEVKPTDAAIEVAPATAAPGTVVEGVGVVNAEGVVVANDVMQQTPPRRRPPPPKKKNKRAGPGRGKKKVLFAEGGADQGTPTSNADSDSLAVPGVKQNEGSVPPSDGGDTPMADAGADDEEGSSEEGSDEEEQDGDSTLNPSTAPSVRPAPTSQPATDLADVMDVTPSEAIAVPEPPVASSIEKTEPATEETLSTMPVRVLETSDPKVEPDLTTSLDDQLPDAPRNEQNSLPEAPVPIINTEPAIPEPEVVPAPIPSEGVVPTTEPEVAPVPEPEPELAPALEPEPESLTHPVIEPITEPEPEKKVEPEPESKPEPIVVPAAEPSPEAVVAPIAAPVLEPEAPLIPEPEPELEAALAPETIPEPQPELEAIIPEKIIEAATAATTATAVTEEATTAPPAEPTAPVSAPASEPDLLGSLEKHLDDKEDEEMAGT